MTKSTIILLVTAIGCSLFFFNCSFDEADDTTTFLELHDDTAWIDTSSYEDEITYLRFIDDPNKILQIYNKLIPSGRACYTCFYICEIWGELEIIENSEFNLKMRIHPPDWELNTTTYCFHKITNNEIELKFCIFDGNDVKFHESIMVLAASNTNLAALKICND